jgi:hypothetical protein
MIGACLIIALVFGIVLSYFGIIHHFWLCHVFKEALEQPPGYQSTKGQPSKRQHRRLIPIATLSGRPLNDW